MSPSELEVPSSETDYLGMSIAKAPVDDSMNIRDFKYLKDSVYGSLSKGVKAGTGPSKPYDIAGEVFLKNHGKYLGSQSEEMAAMNKEYGPFANAKRWAYKTFKPGKEREVQRGATVLRNWMI